MAEADVMPQTWYEATRVASPERARLAYELDVDVCVIGGGLAGLTVAHEVARRGWSVAVLEANRVAWAASGRNTGFVLPGFSDDIDSMVERVGLDHAKQLWALSEAGVDHVRRTIAQTGMPGVDPVDGWLKISKRDDGNAIPAYVERLRWIGADVEAWTTDRVREVLPSRYYFNAVHFPRAFHMHPLNYALGLAAAAEAAGTHIFEETPALAVDTAGVRKRIATPGARVRAAHVVLAGNVDLGALMPRLAATLMPINTYVMVSEPLGPHLAEVIRYRGAVSDGERADNHYRIVGGDRLQWAGRMTVWPAEPRRFARALTGDIRRKFPALGPVKAAYLWRGTLGRSVHRMPQIGEIERGLWVASGFGGHGLNTTAMAGDLIARGIVDGDQTWRLFAPYELVWAGGLIGRAAVQTVYWGAKPLDPIKRRFARSRERARRRKAARRARYAPAEVVTATEQAETGPEAAAPLEAAVATPTAERQSVENAPPASRTEPEGASDITAPPAAP
jgi:glycine/D-amino acid oxidase-like deaminating enzyme